MTKLLTATAAALTMGLILVVLGSFTPAHAAESDSGALDITNAEAVHPTCGKAARELIARSKRDYYTRSTAFMRIQHARLVAANISTTNTLPSGANIVSTDVVRCVGRAMRKGSRQPTTFYYAITFAPDIVDWLLGGLAGSTPPPPPTYSLTYTTGSTAGW